MNHKNNFKTKRLAKSNYDRPEITYTDTLQTNAHMNEKLKNYVRVDDVEDIPLYTHVRYVNYKNGKQRFCLGGIITKIHKKYVILSNGTYSWSVQRYYWADNNDDEPSFETAFFRILSENEIQQKIIAEKDMEIAKLNKIINNH